MLYINTSGQALQRAGKTWRLICPERFDSPP